MDSSLGCPRPRAELPSSVSLAVSLRVFLEAKSPLSLMVPSPPPIRKLGVPRNVPELSMSEYLQTWNLLGTPVLLENVPYELYAADWTIHGSLEQLRGHQMHLCPGVYLRL